MNELKFLAKNYNHDDLMNETIKHGYVNLVKYLIEKEYTWNKKMSCVNATYQDSILVHKTHEICLELLIFCLKNNCKPCHSQICDCCELINVIFDNDNLLCFMYLHKNGYIDQINKFRKEQDDGKYHVFRGGGMGGFFKTYGPDEKYSNGFIYPAESKGANNCLQFLYENKYKYSANITSSFKCNYEMFQHALDIGSKIPEKSYDLICSFIADNKMDCLKLC